MRPLIVLGACLGAAIALLVAAVTPARLTAAQALDLLSRPPQQPVDGRGRFHHTIAHPLLRLGLPRRQVRHDLAVLDRDIAAFLARQASLAGLGLLAPSATVAALNLMGAGISWTTPAWMGLLLASGGYLVAEASVHADAEQRRRLLRHTIAALLDLIPPALAAGAGIGQALTDTTAIASGWASDRIRHTLHTARLTHQPPAHALRDLGERTGVVELEQLAGTLQLAGEEGARIRAALIERGEALAQRLAAETEAQAEAATERMSVPLMALTAVFLLALIYPALAAFRA
ncbi:type II secretion system F family protein [Phytohabitans kaempferiae]|uniref:Type II secretion system F family protein n=1 Tax=Phytohabitans kaempferiae TaxID=1620943 RepID=A0ABV6M9F0_9ACTN